MVWRDSYNRAFQEISPQANLRAGTLSLTILLVPSAILFDKSTSKDRLMVSLIPSSDSSKPRARKLAQRMKYKSLDDINNDETYRESQ